MTVQDNFLALLLDPEPPTVEVVDTFIEMADAIILGYLGLTALPAAQQINQARVLLAIVLYNRRGAEGEAHRAEGDLRSTFEAMPLLVKLQLRPFRTARALGSAGEAQG